MRFWSTVLKHHFEESSNRETYINKTTQNEIIENCSEETLSTIVNRIKKATFYSIIFDETTDASQKSQLSLSLGYVHDDHYHEDFVGFIDNSTGLSETKLTGVNLGKIVLGKLKNLGVNLADCIGIESR